MAKKNSDTVVLQLKADIAIKKEALKKVSEKFAPVTNCMLTLHGERFNLNTINKDTILYLSSQLDAMNASLQVRFPGEALIISGFPVEEWIVDLYNLYIRTNRKTEEVRLKKLEERLTNLLSNDKKVELELDEIQNALK